MRVKWLQGVGKNTRYKYVFGMSNGLKDLPCSSEWIDVCYKWLFENMQWVKTWFICTAAIAKYLKKPTSKTYFKLSSFNFCLQTKLFQHEIIVIHLLKALN